jgi:hypothetical protein
MVDRKYDYTTVPDDPAENAAWRAKTLKMAAGSERFQNQLLDRCRKDFWYWSMGFAYVFEPRILDDDAGGVDEEAGLKTEVPFLPWPHQIPVINRILKVLGKRDLRIVKSRAQGASWIVILICTWLWLFRPGSKCNFVSMNESAVDRKGDMDALMPKADWLLERLPDWMVGRQRKDWNRNYSDHTLFRMDGVTAMAGYACTGDVASGGRALVFIMDEHAKHPRGADKDAMAATQPITRCRICISTPKGQDGAFHDIIHDDSIEEPVLRLAWWDNPTQNRGLYQVVKGKPVAVDEKLYGPLFPEYLDRDSWASLRNKLEERGYDLTNHKFRSRWYDFECLRIGAGPVLIAQEYDMNFSSSVSRYFADALVNRLLNQSVRRPAFGEFHINPETLIGKWSENVDGRFRLWTELDIRGRPPMGEYIVGADVAAGTGGEGSSNSSISVLNRRTGQKVLGFASSVILPYELAEIAIALCRWFVDYHGDPGFLIWEANGYGGEFKTRVERSDFQYYYRRKPKDSSMFARDSGKAGYWTYMRSLLLGPYREALLEGRFDNPDKDSIDELRQYQMGADGEPYHVAEKNKSDPSGAGAAHGDRCFVAGTMILTDCGERPIEQMQPGDLVWTRKGLRPVIACGKTGEEPVFSVQLSNGRSLVGTGNHPVWTINRGWCLLSSLTSCDTLLAYQQQSECEVRPCQNFEAVCTSVTRARKPSYSMEESITETPTLSKNIGNGIFGGVESPETETRSRFMSRFGSFTMGLFRKGISAITGITTLSTTTSKISNALPRQNTGKSTETAKTSPDTRTRGYIGTSVSSAGPCTSHGESGRHDFAAQSVLRSICARVERFAAEARESTYANSVAVSTSRGGRPELASVAISAGIRTMVLSVLPVPGRHAVYNLSVADIPEYFAQGVLVHNCISDALAWHASMSFGDQHFGMDHQNRVNVMNVREEQVAPDSAAWRRARYLKLLRQEKQETNW